LCTYLYLSGLSAGDCIFSGRRAGRHAADPAIDHSVSHPDLSALHPLKETIPA
jgi:3-oxo-5alpha-steroid 4-dehydrogenase